MHETPTIITLLKNAGYVPALILGLSTESYAILGTLMIVDTIFGVARVGTLYGWEHISSYRLSSGVLSKLSIIGVPLFIAMAGRGAGMNLNFVAQGAIGMLCLAQLYSILGNVYSIRTKQEVREFDAVSWVLRRLQTIIERLIKDDTKTVYPPLRNGVTLKKEDEDRNLSI